MNFGTGIVLFGAAVYGSYAIDTFSFTRELEALNQRQGEYLYRWLASGASSDLFWPYRNHARACAKADQLPAEEMHEASEKLQGESWKLQLRLRRELILRATGTRDAYSFATHGPALEPVDW